LPIERLTIDDLKKEHFKIDDKGSVTIKSDDIAKTIKSKLFSESGDPSNVNAIRVAIDSG